LVVGKEKRKKLRENIKNVKSQPTGRRKKMSIDEMERRTASRKRRKEK